MRPLFSCLALLTLLPGLFAAEIRHVEDAAIRAITFVDEREGWAVGDEGVIWHTIDGGTTWERQASGVRASLRSVYFPTPYNGIGWIAGREERPGGGSIGVVLFTRDGGVAWRRILVNSLPGLHLVKFVDAQTGYLAGEGTDAFPSGVFATTNGGRSWQPVPGARATCWRAGDFGQEGGALAGAWNRLATVRRGQVHALDMDTLGGRTLGGLQLRGDDAVAVGQGGLVLLSKKSRGSSWHYAELKLPRAVVEALDLHAVAGQGQHIWAVGRPGSVVLHSPDFGQTWELLATGQSLPLHGLYFHNEQRGWAVGELGTILTTRDGGKTWQVQRRGGQRLAVLCLTARPADMPLDTITALGARDGYLTASLCLTAAEPGSAEPARVGEDCRFAEAVRQAGGAIGETLWQFPMSTHLSGTTAETLLAHWDRLHGGQSVDRLQAALILAIRTYRPDVILTSGGSEALSHLLAEVAARAFRRAADPSEQPEHLSGLHLPTHKTGKLYRVDKAGPDSTVRLDNNAVAGRLGGSVREFSTAPLALLGQGPAPVERTYRLLAATLTGAEAHSDLMMGLSLAVGGVARREQAEEEELSQEATRAIRQRAQMWALAENPAQAGPGSSDQVLSQIGPMLADLPGDTGARVAHGLAQQYARRGQWLLARETYLLLLERYPAHQLAIDGYRWLLLHQASSEARRRHELGQFLVVGQTLHGQIREEPRPVAQPTAKDKSTKETTGRRVGDLPSFATKQQRELAYLNTPEDARRWYQGCLTLEKKLAGFGPLYVSDPTVQFSVQSARRQLGETTAALQWFRDFVATQPDGPWKTAAQAELWLANRVGPAPKPVLMARPTAARPFLDGQFDEPCWQQAQSVRLQNAIGRTQTSHPTEVRLTHDRDFLYVAVRCGSPEASVASAAQPRTRDQDLRSQDRVSLLLDLDRDYGTYFHLQVDARGCVLEDCWGDRSWNPRWFVAVQREGGTWSVEAAIPRTALTGDHLTPGKCWAFNAIRILPGQGVQAFSLPAEAPEEAVRPEGMGLLLFGQDREHAARRADEPTAR